MVGGHTSIRIINQILDFLSEHTVPESEFSVTQLIERGSVRDALKEVLSFATPLLSQIPLQGIERYLGFFFGSGRFLFILVVSWGSVLAATQPFECCQQERKAGVGFLQFQSQDQFSN
jgi:hypothetical protein